MSFEKYGMMTATGARIVLDEPEKSDIRILDIAWSLARQCRFNGHIRVGIEHYSVAQHSVLVSKLCSQEYALIGLLHDAAEAYIGDIVRPMKRLLGKKAVDGLEYTWAMRIGQEFGLGDQLWAQPTQVVWADQVMLATEMRDVYFEDVSHEVSGLGSEFLPMKGHIVPCGAKEAVHLFLARYMELYDGQHSIYSYGRGGV